MKKSRVFEESIAVLWARGLISGEMHLGTGEEAIIAGVVTLLQDGDAMALDHRGTSALLMRGVDPVALLREILGRSDGLCSGQGGHMHLFSRDHLAASSGIVGAVGPTAVGFALAARHLRPGSVAVAFFGEGAMNQGMLLESLNLAATWRLPVLFVCKDDGWAITATPDDSRRGAIGDRVRGLGVQYDEVDGLAVEDVWNAADKAIDDARSERGPSFLHAHCVHLEGHFLGLPLLRAARRPFHEMPAMAVPLTRSFLTPGGAALGERLAGLRKVMSAIAAARSDRREHSENDPVVRLRERLLSDMRRLADLEAFIETEVAETVASALDGVPA
jgi:acetoin:2,6-dichlorophenolindophenol oxidoreductase subunit alpha